MKERRSHEEDVLVPVPEDDEYGDEYDDLWDDEDLGGLADDAMLQEAAARTSSRRGSGGPRAFYWGVMAPFILVGAVGVAAITLVVSQLAFDDGKGVVEYAGLAAAGSVLVFVPLMYYVIRTRLEQPLERLENELRGHLPWRPEGDVLLGSLRRAVENVRTAAYSAREELEEEAGRLEETHARLHELQQADEFAEHAARALQSCEKTDDIAPIMGELVRSVWPADDLMLMEVGEQEVRVVYHESRGRQVSVEDPEETPAYRRSTLPTPVKEALRRGFYAEAGLPFSQDAAFPEARSFVAMSLEHRGSAAGVLLATSSELTPPPPEPVRRVRPLFSLAFSRSVYIGEAEEAAIRDALTGTYTHNHFLSVVRNEVARANRYGRTASCVLLDIDRLRRVNDGYGAAYGDQVIAEVADILERTIRTSDVVARVSGGTFALLLPETAGESALIAAERMREAVEEHPFIIQRGHIERLTVTVGVASHPPLGVTALALVDASRKALRQAKRSGRNCVQAAPAPEEAGDAPASGPSS